MIGSVEVNLKDTIFAIEEPQVEPTVVTTLPKMSLYQSLGKKGPTSGK